MSQYNMSDEDMANMSMVAKNAQRDEIQKEIEAFLKQGGKIEVLECGKSALVNTAAANDGVMVKENDAEDVDIDIEE